MIHSATRCLDGWAKNGLLVAFVDRVSTVSTVARYSCHHFPHRLLPLLLQEARPTAVTDLGHGGMDAAMVRGGGVLSGGTE